MRVIDPKLRKRFRGFGRCDFCGKVCQNRECAHYLAKGIGGGGQIDVSFNLIALGGPLDPCRCHHRQHQGEIIPCDLLAVIAAREGMSQFDVEKQLARIRQAPKDASLCADCEGRGFVRCGIYKTPGSGHLTCIECTGTGILLCGRPPVDLRRKRR